MATKNMKQETSNGVILYEIENPNENSIPNIDLYYTYHLKLKQLFDDKIFQYFFHKNFQHKKYSEFLTFSDMDKFEFLLDLYLFIVKEKDSCCYNNNNSNSNSNVCYPNVQQFHTAMDPVIRDKMNLLKYDTSINTVLNSMQKFNMATSSERNYASSTKFATFKEEGEEIRATFRKILEKFPISWKKSENVKNEDELCIEEDFNECNERIHSSSINKNVSLARDFNNEIQYLDINRDIELANRVYQKVDYHQMKKIKMAGIKQECNLYTCVNLEQVLQANEQVILSQGNDILPNSKFEMRNMTLSGSFKNIITHLPNKEMEFKILSSNGKVSSSDYSFQFALPKQSQMNTYKKTVSKIKDLIILNQTITQNTEVTIEKTKMKSYNGEDIIDMIFSCPPDNIIILDYNDTNKLGTLLIDYAHLEQSHKKLNTDIMELQMKYEEEIQNIKESLDNQISYWKEINHQKQKAVDIFAQELNKKLSNSKTLISNDNEYHFDDCCGNFEMLEEIRKKIDLMISKQMKQSYDYESTN